MPKQDFSLPIEGADNSLPLYDLHTHTLHCNAIINIGLEEGFKIYEGYYYSVGIHPWWIADWHSNFDLYILANHPQVVAIGECGIDRAIGTPLIEQEQLFEQHIILSETVQKPLIIHVVRALDRLLALHKKYQPKQQWIVHGFRGNRAQVVQLTNNGIAISLGRYFNEDAARSIPHSMLYAETDDALCGIEIIYEQIAAIRYCTVATLRQAIGENIQCHFFKR